MEIVSELKYNFDELEELFPAGEEGQDVKPTEAASKRAAEDLNVPWQDITWHAPDTFDIRYGSSYVATAIAGNRAVRFHTLEGNFLPGDDK